VRALDSVDLKFEETGMVFVLGKSGSGKSTLLNLIGGLDSVTSETIAIKKASLVKTLLKVILTAIATLL